MSTVATAHPPAKVPKTKNATATGRSETGCCAAGRSEVDTLQSGTGVHEAPRGIRVSAPTHDRHGRVTGARAAMSIVDIGSFDL